MNGSSLARSTYPPVLPLPSSLALFLCLSIFSPRKCLEIFLVVTMTQGERKRLLTSSRWRSEILLNILQGTWYPPPTKKIIQPKMSIEPRLRNPTLFSNPYYPFQWQWITCSFPNTLIFNILCYMLCAICSTGNASPILFLWWVITHTSSFSSSFCRSFPDPSRQSEMLLFLCFLGILFIPLLYHLTIFLHL